MYSYSRNAAGAWLLLDENNEIIHKSKEIGVIYTVTSASDGISSSVLKHGDIDILRGYMSRVAPVYKSAGLDIPKLVIVHDSANSDDVNYVLDRSCIPEEHFKKLGYPVLESNVISQGLS